MRHGLASIFWCRWLMAGLLALVLSPAAAPGQAPQWEALMLAETLLVLGDLALRQGQPAKAEPLLRRALAVSEKSLGGEHPQVARAVASLAAVSRIQGKFAEAEPLYQWALAVREKVFGPEHPEVAESLEAYAVLLRQTQREAEAAPLEARARAIRARLGRERP